MEKIAFSRHAEKRYQQRGFKKEYVHVLLCFGERHRKPHNAYEFRLTKKAIKRMGREDIKKFSQQIDKARKKAIVMDANLETIITLFTSS